jgi:hypothetical protein
MPEVVLPEWTLARLRSSVPKAHRQTPARQERLFADLFVVDI